MIHIQLQKYTSTLDIQILDIQDSHIEHQISYIIDNYETIFSRFLENSELSLLNKKKEAEVSEIFSIVLSKAIKISEFTHGYFNPLIQLSRIWYIGKEDFIDNNNNININDNIKVEGKNITLLNNNNLDLWWIAKGYLVDFLAQFLQKKWSKYFYINFGGDIYFSEKNEAWEKWKLWIEDPFLNNGENIWVLEIEKWSVSTSGSYKRNWKKENHTFHHIITPKTWENCQEIMNTTIIWEHTFFTDAIATSVFAMWIKKALKFLDDNDIDWLIISRDKKIYYSKSVKEKYNVKIKNS